MSTLTGFKGGFAGEYRRAPTEQEIWNAAYAAGVAAASVAQPLPDPFPNENWGGFWTKDQEPPLVESKPIGACSICYGTGFDVSGKQCPFPHRSTGQVGNFGDSGQEQLRQRVQHLPLPDYR
jgi:hypothetical protein